MAYFVHKDYFIERIVFVFLFSCLLFYFLVLIIVKTLMSRGRLQSIFNFRKISNLSKVLGLFSSLAFILYEIDPLGFFRIYIPKTALLVNDLAVAMIVVYYIFFSIVAYSIYKKSELHELSPFAAKMLVGLPLLYMLLILIANFANFYLGTWHFKYVAVFSLNSAISFVCTVFMIIMFFHSAHHLKTIKFTKFARLAVFVLLNIIANIMLFVKYVICAVNFVKIEHFVSKDYNYYNVYNSTLYFLILVSFAVFGTN
ncbi:hypothetical protein MHBO_002545 [Bonamia ostreae]|uniref:Uncharacterized protein n=1 Tax=Bonamia ostreae TaxID=126728 RepID=A0ABV2AMP2_9EUKA